MKKFLMVARFYIYNAVREMFKVQSLDRLKQERERTSQVWQHVKEIWETHTEFKTKTDVLIAALDLLEIDLNVLQKQEKIQQFYSYDNDHAQLCKKILMFRQNWADKYFSKEDLAWLKAHYPKVAESRSQYFARIKT